MLAAVVVGAALPGVAALSPLVTPILAGMIGSISLTLPPAAFRAVGQWPLATLLVIQTGMPVAAYLIARGLGLSPALTAGFVVLGAVTPELVAPEMPALADGETALTSTVLVCVGIATVALVPVAVRLSVGEAVAVDTWRGIEQLLLAVVGPMALAVGFGRAIPTAWAGTTPSIHPSLR